MIRLRRLLEAATIRSVGDGSGDDLVVLAEAAVVVRLGRRLVRHQLGRRGTPDLGDGAAAAAAPVDPRQGPRGRTGGRGRFVVDALRMAGRHPDL